jgi:hypothetical protein
VTKITSVQWITLDNKNSKQVVKSLEEWAAKILCQDNDYVQNLANAGEETKKCFQRTKNIRQINMLCQLHPTNPTMRKKVTMIILSGSHQNNNDTKLQTNHICIFVISWWKGLGQWLRHLTKKKDIKLLNSANEAAACLVELANKEHDKNFSNLEQMQAYTKEQVTRQKKEPGNESSTEEEEDGNKAV